MNFLDLMLLPKGTEVFYYLKNILASFLIMNYQKVQLHTTYHWTQVSKKSLAGPVTQILYLTYQCTANKLTYGDHVLLNVLQV